jgi:hydroxymethylpyrimidine/phosphomethylpyrimidine kinase
LACRLAMREPLMTAVAGAKQYVRAAMEHAYPLGRGSGPINHLFRLNQ